MTADPEKTATPKAAPSSASPADPHARPGRPPGLPWRAEGLPPGASRRSGKGGPPEPGWRRWFRRSWWLVIYAVLFAVFTYQDRQSGPLTISLLRVPAAGAGRERG